MDPYLSYYYQYNYYKPVQLQLQQVEQNKENLHPLQNSQRTITLKQMQNFQKLQLPIRPYIWTIEFSPNLQKLNQLRQQVAMMSEMNKQQEIEREKNNQLNLKRKLDLELTHSMQNTDSCSLKNLSNINKRTKK